MKDERFIRKLSEFRKVALDVMCFVYFFEANLKYSALCQVIFDLAEQNKLKLLTSILCYTEVQVVPKREKNIVLERKYRNIFSRLPNLEVILYDWEIAEKASTLRAKYKIKLPNAINLASGILAQAEAFITNDRTLLQVKEIPVIVLEDYTR